MGSMMNEEENSTPALDLASALKRTLEAHNQVVSNYVMIETGLREELGVTIDHRDELLKKVQALEVEVIRLTENECRLNEEVHHLKQTAHGLRIDLHDARGEHGQ